MKAKREPAAVWLNEPDQFNFIREGAEIYAVSNRLMPLYQQAQKRLRLLLAGIPVATEKGKDLIPQQGLALSRKLKRAAFPMVQLSYQDALTYLRKEQIALNPTAQRGITAVMFGTSVLGFAKNLGNRANNLYPAEWKIRSSHLPDTYQQLINPINLT